MKYCVLCGIINFEDRFLHAKCQALMMDLKADDGGLSPSSYS